MVEPISLAVGPDSLACLGCLGVHGLGYILLSDDQPMGLGRMLKIYSQARMKLG